MSKTLLRHTLTKNILDIVVDFLIFIHFHFMKIHRSPLQRQNIFDKILVSEYKLFKRSNKASLVIALVQ
jgi:hypothetical protein